MNFFKLLTSTCLMLAGLNAQAIECFDDISTDLSTVMAEDLGVTPEFTHARLVDFESEDFGVTVNGSLTELYTAYVAGVDEDNLDEPSRANDLGLYEATIEVVYAAGDDAGTGGGSCFVDEGSLKRVTDEEKIEEIYSAVGESTNTSNGRLEEIGTFVCTNNDGFTAKINLNEISMFILRNDYASEMDSFHKVTTETAENEDGESTTKYLLWHDGSDEEPMMSITVGEFELDPFYGKLNRFSSSGSRELLCF